MTSQCNQLEKILDTLHLCIDFLFYQKRSMFWSQRPFVMRKVFGTQNVNTSVVTEGEKCVWSEEFQPFQSWGMKKDSSLRCSSSYPARYLNLFCASEEEIIQGQVKVSLYSGVLRLHHSWLQASKLKWSIICIEVLQEKKTNKNYSWCSKYEIWQEHSP